MTYHTYSLLFLLLSIPFAGHTPSEKSDGEQSRPNILWLTLEDTSEYQFGCYGNTDINTPVIDMIAKKGIRFANASSTAPHCSAGSALA